MSTATAHFQRGVRDGQRHGHHDHAVLVAHAHLEAMAVALHGVPQQPELEPERVEGLEMGDRVSDDGVDQRPV